MRTASAVNLGELLAAARREVERTPGASDEEAYARAVTRRLHDAGYAIHALDGRCIRLPAFLEGREATEADSLEVQPIPRRWPFYD